MTIGFEVLVAILAIAFLFTLFRIAIHDRLPYEGALAVKCPETQSAASVQVDQREARRSTLRGIKKLRLKTCSRWPERADCDQECLVQIEPTPAILDRIFDRWYADKNCVRCDCPLDENDWRWGRVAVVDANSKFIELRHMDLTALPGSLQGCKPVCWKCHEAERAQRPVRAVFFKGDRTPRAMNKFVFRD